MVALLNYLMAGLMLRLLSTGHVRILCYCDARMFEHGSSLVLQANLTVRREQELVELTSSGDFTNVRSGVRTSGDQDHGGTSLPLKIYHTVSARYSIFVLVTRCEATSPM